MVSHWSYFLLPSLRQANNVNCKSVWLITVYYFYSEPKFTIEDFGNMESLSQSSSEELPISNVFQQPPPSQPPELKEYRKKREYGPKVSLIWTFSPNCYHSFYSIIWKQFDHIHISPVIHQHIFRNPLWQPWLARWYLLALWTPSWLCTSPFSWTCSCRSRMEEGQWINLQGKARLTYQIRWNSL